MPRAESAADRQSKFASIEHKFVEAALEYREELLAEDIGQLDEELRSGDGKWRRKEAKIDLGE